MADKTGIEWTDATWNPLVGCTIVSKGCTNCYAMKQAGRIIRMTAGAGQATHYAGTVKDSKAGPVWTGKVNLAPEAALTQPLRWKRPRRIFVNSMSDMFHESVPDEWIDRIFAVMALAPQHTFQVLTKRPERMRAYLRGRGRQSEIIGQIFEIPQPGPTGRVVSADTDGELFLAHWPLPNVWLGTSVEDQATADKRIPHLLATPAAIRWVSAEPLLGLLHILKYLYPLCDRCPPWETPCRAGCDRCTRLDWFVTGGESGPGARTWEGYLDAVRSIRDQCAAAGVPFLYKQHGAWAWASEDKSFEEAARHARLCYGKNVTIQHFSNGRSAAFVGKKRAGRTLDGKIHDGYPGALA